MAGKLVNQIHIQNNLKLLLLIYEIFDLLIYAITFLLREFWI